MFSMIFFNLRVTAYIIEDVDEYKDIYLSILYNCQFNNISLNT